MSKSKLGGKNQSKDYTRNQQLRTIKTITKKPTTKKPVRKLQRNQQLKNR